MSRIDRADEVVRRLLQTAPNAGDGPDPELMQIIQRFVFGEVFFTGELSDQMRELITISCLATIQTLPQLEIHVRAALTIGVSPLEIRETIYQLAPFIGFPRCLNAVAAMNRVLTDLGISLPLEAAATVTEETRHDAGHAIQHPVYGDEISRRWADLPNGLGADLAGFLTDVTFGDFATRAGLDQPTRELLILCSLASLGATPQLTAHARGNLAVGNSLERMVTAMIHCLPYIGFPATFNALTVIVAATNA